MPIDFAAIADDFRTPLEQQLKTATAAFGQIGVWLTKLVPKAEDAERRTRAIPIILFRSGALTVSIDRSQWRTLGVGLPAPTVWARMAEGGRRFVRGLGLVPHMVREEMILPRTYGVIRDSLFLILDSVERFLPLTRASGDRPLHLFNLDRPGQASDLFGGGALLGYTYLASRDGIRRLTQDVTALQNLATGQDWGGLIQPVRASINEIIGVFRPAAPGAAPSPTPTADPSGARSMPLPMLLRTITEGIVGAIMILPLIPAILGPMVEAAILRGRVLVLDTMQALERKVFEVRRTIVDVFAKQLPTLGTRFYDLLAVTAYLVDRHLVFFTRFGLAYVQEFFDRFYPYLRRLSRFMLTVTRLADFLRRMWDAVMNFDLMPILLQAIGIPPALLSVLPSPPSLTVGDILEAISYGTVGALMMNAAVWIEAARLAFLASPAGLADRLAGSPIAGRMAAARTVLATAAVRLPQSYADRPRPTPPPGALTMRFPNLLDTFTGGPLNLANLGASLEILGLQARLSTLQIFNAGALALDQSAVAFDESARAVTLLGDRQRYADIVAWSERIGGVLYDEQIGTLQGRVGRVGFGRDYDAFLVRRGFEVMEAIVPLYIDAMRDYWRDRVLGRAEGNFAPQSGLPAYDLPTSPHLLDRRARLGRVRVPRMTVRAPARPVTRDLADAVVAHFKTEVERVYTVGLDRLPD